MNGTYRVALFGALVLMLCATACTGSKKLGESQASPQSTTFQSLMTWMSGEFDSSEQALLDSNYYDITLRMVPIWESTDKVGYLYVEQSVTGSPKPYRQRIYEVKDLGNNEFESAIYLLEADSIYVGAKNGDPVFKNKSIPNYKKKEGCSVMLTFDGNAFAGSTVDQKCISDFRGAAFATSEVVINAQSLTSWDRGFDAEANQVWGAENGAYIFKRENK